MQSVSLKWLLVSAPLGSGDPSMGLIDAPLVKDRHWIIDGGILAIDHDDFH
eukprot:m.272454 g.272454  ORF g.272454 m.272454 type:complete len:51 (+) comp44037_c0_seq1:123-275(+)